MAKISPEQYEEYRRALKRMRMMDDTLMKCVFKDLKQYHLCLLKQEITEVIFQKETQKKLIIMVIQNIILP